VLPVPILKPKAMNNDLTKYLAVRDSMKTGDGLGFANNSLIGRTIMWRTKKDGPIPHSHWGGLIRLSEFEGLPRRRFTLEAMSAGFYPDILSRAIVNYDGHIWWYPLLDGWDPWRQEIGEKALALIGTGYDWGGLFKQAFVRVSADARRLFCSEAWQIIYGFKGLGLNPTQMYTLGIFKPPVQLI
jgi:hypothetical protein